MTTYDSWLAKIRKRAKPSGTLSQWAILLAQKQGGDAEIWREYLRDILDEREKASLTLILDLDLILEKRASGSNEENQMPLL